MWVSTRFTFREGDPGWSGYLKFIGLPQLKEVRTLDAMLNSYVDGCGSREVETLTDARHALRELPRAVGECQYHLLFLDAEQEKAPPEGPDCRLLGHDLSDETRTSSLLNCGPWTGQLAPLTERLNGYGLLAFHDAALAKTLLSKEWPADPHGKVTIWALYEIAPESGAR
ncbi:hypothetical protein FGE12_12225 [Aggregicoccus sp. 17bor-14]|uniref:hypothetical protein n=1 Tax=Myxococcaceae TaxID=31 RepID=UPI00129C89D2|nr:MULTISPECIES: hypothetical protein [Myxococcaceae]MBF5043156.1 hypothetical protein [Simulacricoccus sp. 17bor-14]MRI88915.1 hypothetical protein [Aggregicoccus sp. 17bor-14]